MSSSTKAMLLTPLLLGRLVKTLDDSTDHIFIDLSEEQDIKYLESNEKSQSQTHFLCPTSLDFK
jgi:hypothetical protein